MSRCEGRANTVFGAAHFLRETVGRVRHAGATGQLTVRADSGFYAHALVVVAARWMSASPSANTPASDSRRTTPVGWTAAPKTTFPPPSRPMCGVGPGSQSYDHGFTPTGTGKPWNRRSPPAEIENAIRDLKHGVGLNHYPANGAWLAVQVLAHNLARWTARIGTTRTLPALAGGAGPPPHFASATGLALGNPVLASPLLPEAPTAPGPPA